MPLNPLHPLHQRADASFIAYGPEGQTVQVVDTFGNYEAEYAAIRKSVGLIDLPQRGLVRITGDDRVEFLHRMLTNDTRTLQPGQGRRAFLLNTKGRIEADLIVLHDRDQTWLELDLSDVPHLVEQFDKYLFTEDVQIKDLSEPYTRLALHGPEASARLSEVVNDSPSDPASFSDMPLFSHRPIDVAGHRCIVFRSDDTGPPGLHLIVPRDGVAAVYQRLLNALHYDHDAPSTTPNRGRPIGWLAYNTARIEAGTPIFHIDFGPDSLPHETGILDQAVSFTKGCYLGQEIVARMQSLGHPKRILVGLRFNDDRMPIAGTEVYTPTPPRATGQGAVAPLPTVSANAIVGGITSSTVSPMLGGTAIAFAIVKWGTHTADTHVAVPAEGHRITATIQPLVFLKS